MIRRLHDHPATVTFRPGMQSGQPTIGGTRLTLISVLRFMWQGGIKEAQSAYDVTREQCLVAAWFAGTYGIDDLPQSSRRSRMWTHRYGPWAREHHDQLWAGKWALVPDPPSLGDTSEEKSP